MTEPADLTYRGSCHCGAVRFAFTSAPIATGVRCNCSLCARRGAVMSTRYYPPEAFVELAGTSALAVYHWGDRMMNHYFCATCGVFPFADPIAKPGHYRVNLGCLAGVDPLALAITLIDGAAF